MSSTRSFFARPWMPAAAAAAVVLAALAVIPVDYSRTVGYDVQLTLSQTAVPQSTVGQVGAELMKRLCTRATSTRTSARTRCWWRASRRRHAPRSLPRRWRSPAS